MRGFSCSGGGVTSWALEVDDCKMLVVSSVGVGGAGGAGNSHDIAGNEQTVLAETAEPGTSSNDSTRGALAILFR